MCLLELHTEVKRTPLKEFILRILSMSLVTSILYLPTHLIGEVGR